MAKGKGQRMQKDMAWEGEGGRRPGEFGGSDQWCAPQQTRKTEARFWGPWMLVQEEPEPSPGSVRTSLGYLGGIPALPRSVRVSGQLNQGSQSECTRVWV